MGANKAPGIFIAMGFFKFANVVGVFLHNNAPANPHPLDSLLYLIYYIYNSREGNGGYFGR